MPHRPARGRYGAADTGTTAKAGHRPGGPGATSCRTPEGRALAGRRGPQGGRSPTGSSSRGDNPRMKRSAQAGEWSSLHDGGEGMRVPPHRTRVCAGDTVGKPEVCPREAWYRPRGRDGREAVPPADERAGQRGTPRATCSHQAVGGDLGARDLPAEAVPGVGAGHTPHERGQRQRPRSAAGSRGAGGLKRAEGGGRRRAALRQGSVGQR